MDFFNTLLSNPQGVTFSMLFIGLFVYVMKSNETREQHYRTTIEVLTKQLQECHSNKGTTTNG
jgi:hypothetical protein